LAFFELTTSRYVAHEPAATDVMHTCEEMLVDDWKPTTITMADLPDELKFSLDVVSTPFKLLSGETVWAEIPADCAPPRGDRGPLWCAKMRGEAKQRGEGIGDAVARSGQSYAEFRMVERGLWPLRPEFESAVEQSRLVKLPTPFQGEQHADE
jgi:hypothetical protein